jgi:uncharacterized protein YjcR
MTTKELAYKYHVSDRTIDNWKQKSGIVFRKANAIDYDRMDDLIREFKTTREIMAAMGCVKSTVNLRKQKLGLGRKAMTHGSKIRYEQSEKIIPPAERLEQAIKIKRKNLCFTSTQMDWWLKGPAGAQFIGGING